jgi:mannose-6-phosphate isomerase-like protein (cupin superfamily)
VLEDQKRAGGGRLDARVVRYADLKPCYNAFVDTRTPGSEAKENFTIIGPGVSENPAQHVHIAEPHGFNIGGARQPPNCVNSQHSHTTAEVFVAHTGYWRFDLGEHGEDAQVFLGPGDTISLPTHMFRGFTNVGTDTGFLWAVLGGDDPGRVLWAPDVFELAKDHGLILLENGNLVDTASGELSPSDVSPMPVTTREQVAALRRWSQAEADGLVVRDAQGAGLVIGPGGRLDWPHGFTLERWHIVGSADGLEGRYVVFVHRGVVTVEGGDEPVTLRAGDTMTIPADMGRHRLTTDDAVVFAVRQV